MNDSQRAAHRGAPEPSAAVVRVGDAHPEEWQQPDPDAIEAQRITPLTEYEATQAAAVFHELRKRGDPYALTRTIEHVLKMRVGGIEPAPTQYAYENGHAWIPEPFVRDDLARCGHCHSHHAAVRVEPAPALHEPCRTCGRPPWAPGPIPEGEKNCPLCGGAVEHVVMKTQFGKVGRYKAVAGPAPAPEPPDDREPTDEEIHDLIRRILRNNDSPRTQFNFVKTYLIELWREAQGARVSERPAPEGK